MVFWRQVLPHEFGLDWHGEASKAKDRKAAKAGRH
jgi:hypothetical protein